MPENPEPPPDLEVELPMPSGLKVSLEENPYRILFITNLGGNETGVVSGPARDGVVDLTPAGFPAFIQSTKPTARWKAADPLSAANAMVEIEFAVDSIQSFDPVHVAEQVPATRDLLGVRQKLVDRLQGKLTADALRNSIDETIRSNPNSDWLKAALQRGPSPANAQAVNDVLDQLDLGSPEPAAAAGTARNPVGRLVADNAAAANAISAEESSAVRRALAELDRRLSLWLTSILHAPAFQAMESAWRSLSFLISHLEFRRGIRLSVLHASREELLENLRTRVIDPVFDEGRPAPHLILCDFSFTQRAPDIELLDELAQHAASLPAVVLVAAAPNFLGAKFAWQIATLPPLDTLLDQWQFAKWNTLRRQPYARSLGVVIGRGLLRGLHRRSETTDLEFRYREDGLGEKDLIWANGTTVLACAIARSVAESGWPTSFCGPLHGRVEDFAQCTGGPKGDKEMGPADLRLPIEKAVELGSAGLNVVSALGELPDAISWNGVTAAHPGSGNVNAIYEVTLPYQLLAARVGQLLYELKPHLAGMDRPAMAAFVRQHFLTWVQFETEPTVEQLSVQARPFEKDPSAVELAVVLTPPERLLPGGVPIAFGFRI